MSAHQVAPSAFDFKPPKVSSKSKNRANDKDKWIANRPFFGGFGAQTKNKHTTVYNNQASKSAVRAGGFQLPPSIERRNRAKERDNFVVFNSTKAQNTSYRGIGRDPNMGVNIEQKKKSAPRAGGFRISIKKKKNRLEELKKLKNLNADSQGRWVPAPAIKEIAQPNREEVKNQNNNLQRQSSSRVTKRKPLVRLKKPPQSDLADRPIRGKIPGNHIPPLENRQGTRFERFMLEESKSEQFTNLEEHNQLPLSHINNEFSNRPEETSEEEKYYQHRIVQEELQNVEQRTSSEVAQKTENRTDSAQVEEGAEEVKKEFNKSGRSKRKKWDTGGSNKVWGLIILF